MKKLRPPIITVLGHVDHGKTTLLDTLRKTKIASGEAGGITQSIGASQITWKGKKITFIDTPGHAAFEKMRARGAQASDIAVLVVAADDGAMPQTLEALKHIRAAEIPFIVAITKIDLPNANPEMALASLEKAGVLFEGRGGDTPRVLISAPKGEGLDELLEIILLLAEVNEIKADETANLVAVVIETGKDKSGTRVAAIIREGTLTVGDEIQAASETARVRGLFNDVKKSTKKVLPGEPCLILGFKSPPAVGSLIQKGQEVYEKPMIPKAKPGEDAILVVLKAQNLGALEAVQANLPKEIFPIAASVGDISEKDVFLAKSSRAKYIFGFGTKIAKSVAKLAEEEGLAVENYPIIYELTERLNKIIEESKEKILGQAEILVLFPFNDQKVAGCKMLKGEISQKSTLVLSREGQEIGRVKAVSIKKQKEEVQTVKEGEEFGIVFTPQLDFAKGDMLLSVK